MSDEEREERDEAACPKGRQTERKISENMLDTVKYFNLYYMIYNTTNSKKKKVCVHQV